MLQSSELFDVCLADTEGNLRASKGSSCLSDMKMPFRTDVPDLYLCSFASVVYEL